MTDCKHPVIGYTGSTPCTGPRECTTCHAPYYKILGEVADHLEELVDVHGLDQVIDLLAGVCRVKCNHIRDNWQDEPLAKRWLRIAKSLEVAEAKVLKEKI